MRRDALDHWNVKLAICNCLYGVATGVQRRHGAAFTTALNDWVTKEWPDREPRLRASIVVPLQSMEDAVAEIERRASDPRFCADPRAGKRGSSAWPPSILADL